MEFDALGIPHMTETEYKDMARRLQGPDPTKWVFECSKGHRHPGASSRCPECQQEANRMIPLPKDNGDPNVVVIEVPENPNLRAHWFPIVGMLEELRKLRT